MCDHTIVEIINLTDGNIALPKYAKKGDSGMDVRANIKQNIIIMPGESKMIPTGIKVAIPEGYEIQVRPRSGLAYKKQVTVLNTPGTIDSGYRNEIGVILINHNLESSFVVSPGDRIAQIVLAKVENIKWKNVTDLSSSSDRGEDGFGSSGVK
jgi:dUTP pyrophosphatase